MRRLIIWHAPKKQEYYYKIVVGNYKNYRVGYKNSYDHEVIMVIPLQEKIKRTPIKQKLIKRVIRFLEKRIK